MEKLCLILREILIWGNSEPTIVLILTTVGVITMTLMAYAILFYLIPLSVSAVLKKLRRTKFVRRLDRFFYLLRKEYGRKPAASHQDGEEPRVIMTLTGNLNDSQ